MKYKAIYWILLKPLIKKYFKKRFDYKSVKIIFQNAKAEYKRLLNRADDIGANNPMASNLYFSLLFVSFLTANQEKMTKDMLAEMIDSVLSNLNSPFVQTLLRIDLNQERDMRKLKNRMAKNAQWAEKHQGKYPENWRFHFEDKHKDGCFYYFSKCPIAKFFKDNQMEGLTHIFCDLDYTTIGYKKGRLIRQHTIANGDGICDFWIVGDKVKNPQ